MVREQEQFLEVVDRDTAELRWWATIRPERLEAETVALAESLGRVLSEDVFAQVDVPSFDRSNVDGYAIIAEDSYGATEDAPRYLILNEEELASGVVPRGWVLPGTATPIATGGMLPRGADAVLMVEHARISRSGLVITRPVSPGSHVGFAGTDIARGELLLREGSPLSARETGLLAAIGRDRVQVVRRPVVTVLSTGDEIVAPGTPLRPGTIYDANATLIADAVKECGGTPVLGGIIPDAEEPLATALEHALVGSDIVVLSGGTSKGAGDLSFRALANADPGIVVHGVSLKPGKPVCLGAIGRVPVAVLPGFPTSAIFTFHEFVAPVIRQMAGKKRRATETIEARMPLRVNSERGRTEYLLVGLLPSDSGLSAYPMGKGSGSVTTFSRADGFIVIGKNQEYVDRGELVRVTPLGQGIEVADLVAIGSHCTGLDWLLGRLQRLGHRSKTIWVGSQGGLDAVIRGECDIAGIHLLDPQTETYNLPFLPGGVRLQPGYGRMQGIVSRPGDLRFLGATTEEIVARACEDRSCFLVNRNRGSGTRTLIDRLVGSRKPSGFAVEVRSHNAVAAAIVQGRADWGLAIEPIARAYGLEFRPLREERYDFAISETRWDRPAVAAFRNLLDQDSTRLGLTQLGFLLSEEPSQ